MLPLVLLGPAPGTGAPKEPDAEEIFASMGRAADGVRDYKTILFKQERRLDGLEEGQRLLSKWARTQKVYFKCLDGESKGQEVLYVEGWNRDRLRAHKGSFPDFTLNLDPRGSWAMAHTHHPVSETSLLRLIDVVRAGATEALRRREGSVRLAGEEPMLGRASYRIEMSAPPDGITHVVARGETLWDIAKRYDSDMYALLYRNREKGWKGPTSPRPGDRVFVPRYYAGRVTLWVDVKTRLPLAARIYAHDGSLYERYEYHDLETNVGLKEIDFDAANPAYDF